MRTRLSSPADANVHESRGFHAIALTQPAACPSSVSMMVPRSRWKMYTLLSGEC
jgi:hypothetical protein